MSNPPPPAPTAAPARGGMPKWLIILLVILFLVLLCCCGLLTTCYFVGRKAVDVGQQQLGMQFDTGGGVTLPENFPADVTVHSGFRAAFKVAPRGSNTGIVHFTGTETPSKVADFYEKLLTGKGWKQDASSNMGGTIVQGYSKDKTSVQLHISQQGTETELQITYEIEP